MKKWTLSHKVTAIIATLIAVLLVLQVAVQWQVILPAFKQIEVDQAHSEMSRIKQRFLDDLGYLERFVYEYSDWEDSYDFVESRDQEYIDVNLYEGLAIHLGGNVMIYTDNNLELVWGVEEIEVFEELHINDDEELFDTLIEKLRSHIEKIDTEEDIRDQMVIGFNLLDQLPFMYAVRPIVNEDGDQNGYVILVKYIDQHVISLYQKQLESNFVIAPIGTSSVGAVNEISNLQLSSISSAKLSVTDVMQTQGVAIFSITAELFRDINLNGLNSLYLASVILLIVGIISIAFIWIYTSVHFFKPLEALSHQMQEIASSGNYGQKYSIDREDEIGSLANSFNTMISNINSHQHQLTQAQTLLKEANDQLSILVRQDKLTGVANRLAFEESINADWKTFARLELPITIMMMDIDYFKDYNDLYGHLQGDDCLRQVAQVLSSCLKRSNDFFARYGGEEFIATLAGLSSAEAQTVAETLLEKVRQERIPHESSKVASHITLSIGIATVIPTNELSCKDLIEHADQALYEAKAAGRNQLKIHS